MARVQDEFPGDGFQGDIDYLRSDYDAGKPAEIRLLENIIALGGGVGAAQLGAMTPKLAKGAYGVLKGLGNAGEMALGGGTEGVAGAKAVNKGLQALATPEELAEIEAVLSGAGKVSTEGVSVFVKGMQKGAGGEQIPIYGVKGPADKLKALFGDAAPGSVPESVLIEKGLLQGAAKTGMAPDIAAQKALMVAEDTGGATFNLTKGNLAGTPHYAVSVYPERELIMKGEPTTKAIEQYMAKNADLLSDPANSFGIWRDVESGKTYLDVVVTTPDKAAAMKLGLDNGQLAIFDLGKMQEIRIPKGK
jgi:hypothetical protein